MTIRSMQSTAAVLASEVKKVVDGVRSGQLGTVDALRAVEQLLEAYKALAARYDELFMNTLADAIRRS